MSSTMTFGDINIEWDPIRISYKGQVVGGIQQFSITADVLSDPYGRKYCSMTLLGDNDVDFKLAFAGALVREGFAVNIETMPEKEKAPEEDKRAYSQGTDERESKPYKYMKKRRNRKILRKTDAENFYVNVKSKVNSIPTWDGKSLEGCEAALAHLEVVSEELNEGRSKYFFDAAEYTKIKVLCDVVGGFQEQLKRFRKETLFDKIVSLQGELKSDNTYEPTEYPPMGDTEEQSDEESKEDSHPEEEAQPAENIVSEQQMTFVSTVSTSPLPQADYAYTSVNQETYAK